MLTNAQKKLIASLADVKGRRRAGLFTAEGTKCVTDTLGAFTLRQLLATDRWLADHPEAGACNPATVSRSDLRNISSLSLAPDVIAVYELPAPTPFDPESLRGRLTVALDRVQDPGNLGTIIRTADWMGIDTILASTDTVDCYNPKTIQATMGAIARVKVVYGPLPDMLAAVAEPVYGTFLDGTDIYTSPLSHSGIIVMGNEGSGISPEVASCVDRRLLIPSWPPGRPTSESLNVATATAITLSQFISRNYGQD